MYYILLYPLVAYSCETWGGTIFIELGRHKRLLDSLLINSSNARPNNSYCHLRTIIFDRTYKNFSLRRIFIYMNLEVGLYFKQKILSNQFCHQNNTRYSTNLTGTAREIHITKKNHDKNHIRAKSPLFWERLLELKEVVQAIENQHWQKTLVLIKIEEFFFFHAISLVIIFHLMCGIF